MASWTEDAIKNFAGAGANGITYGSTAEANRAIRDLADIGVGAIKAKVPNTNSWKVIYTGEISKREETRISEYEKRYGKHQATTMLERELAEEGIQYLDKDNAEQAARAIQEKDYRVNISTLADNTYRLIVKDSLTGDFVYIKPKEVKKMIDDYNTQIGDVAKAKIGMRFINTDLLGTYDKALKVNDYEIKKDAKGNIYSTTNPDGSIQVSFINLRTGEPVYLPENKVQDMFEKYTGESVKADKGFNIGKTNMEQDQHIEQAMKAKGFTTHFKRDEDGNTYASFTNKMTGRKEVVDDAIIKELIHGTYVEDGRHIADVQRLMKDKGLSSKVIPMGRGQGARIMFYDKSGNAVNVKPEQIEAAREASRQEGRKVRKEIRKEVGDFGKIVAKGETQNTLQTMSKRMEGDKNPAKRLIRESGITNIKGSAERGTDNHPMIGAGYGYGTEGKVPKIQATTSEPKIMSSNLGLSQLAGSGINKLPTSKVDFSNAGGINKEHTIAKLPTIKSMIKDEEQRYG